MEGPVRVKLREAGGCNVCNPALRKAVAEGRDATFDLDGKNCRYCKSPGRQRALARMIDRVGEPLLRELEIAGKARALCAAPGAAERYLLDPLVDSLLTFSLFGSYGKDHIQCDIRDLSRFEAGSFDLFEASLVYDYVPELDLAIANTARVLAPKSAFFIFINEGRLLPGDKPPKVKNTRDRAAGLPEYYPEDYERQQISVGRKWLDAAWRKHGFDVQQVIWHDASIGESFTWWVGRRGGRA
jgi:SAM-dependent methyltransferase